MRHTFIMRERALRERGFRTAVLVLRIGQARELLFFVPATNHYSMFVVCGLSSSCPLGVRTSRQRCCGSLRQVRATGRSGSQWTPGLWDRKKGAYLPLSLGLRAKLNNPGQGDASGTRFTDLAAKLAAELTGGKASGLSESGVPSDEAGCLVDGRNGLPCVRLKNEQTKQVADVYLFGACVTSWKARQGTEEMLFLSEEAVFDRSKPIRGGIPICFPQFGSDGALPNHGFARNVDWKLRSIDMVENGTASRCVLMLSSEEVPSHYRDLFPFKFSAEYAVTLNLRGLRCELRITNLETDRPMPFTAALHNYLRVRDVSKIRVFGYDNLEYLDKMDANTMKREESVLLSGLPVEAAVDRVYKNAPDEMALFDMVALTVMKIDKRGFTDCTLWNPYGQQGSDPDWQKFICIEPAVFHDKGVELKPNESWTGYQELSAE
jgi:glucose-6-phosphate 1-epimerase